ncbi:unnamed protein product [Rhizophagus irregularis]|uniref:Uncharacterized protein n=1 Tax=Rhizophagus irregularis TaxID=588596 RepID=A0A915YP85_9GLOM|nr:unnamed protein product [Rhizophagus irregularis]
MELREQWHYSQDNLPCYVAPGIHLKLTAKLLATWAECICTFGSVSFNAENKIYAKNYNNNINNLTDHN